MSNHLWDDPRITAYALDQLGESETRAFESELAEDPSLAAAVANAKVVANQLEQHFASEEIPDAGVSVNPSSRSANGRRLWIPVAIAASIGLLIVGLNLPTINGNRQALRPAESLDASRAEKPRTNPLTKGVAGEMDRRESTVDDVAATDEAFGDGMAKNEAMVSDFEEIAPHPFEPAAPAPSSAIIADKSSMGSPASLNATDSFLYEMSDEAIAPSRENASVEFLMEAEQNLGVASAARMDGAAIGRIEPGAAAKKQLRLGRASTPPVTRDRYQSTVENSFQETSERPLSTFSIDVDTASYTKARSLLLAGQTVPTNAVRPEEWINYFEYDYDEPTVESEYPLSADVMLTECPWNDGHRIARIGVQAVKMESNERPDCNLVFLIDSSGSMRSANKLPLVIDGLKQLVRQLGPNDRVSIVTYAGDAGVVADGLRGDQKRRLRQTLRSLSAGGSTNGAGGITVAYEAARDHFIDGGVNRVILCSDGDFNVGLTSDEALVDLVAEQAMSDVFLTVLGFGNGNLNDSMLEKISGRGNGNYGFIDTPAEAKRWFVDKLTGTLVTVAKDVKIQVEFNPAVVSEYRLIGYENRMLAARDFNDDRKDAGEVGAGHQVTALYEWIPIGSESVDTLRYRSKPEVELTDPPSTEEAMFVKLRYKPVQSNTSIRFDVPVANEIVAADRVDESTRFALSVAGAAMKVAGSETVRKWSVKDIESLAEASADDRDERNEFIELLSRIR